LPDPVPTTGWIPAIGEEWVGTANADVVTFDEALTDAGAYKDAWPLVDKAELVAKPFLIVGIRSFEGMGDDGIAFNVRIILKGSDERISFNDGSTGVYKQLRQILATMDRPRPMLVEGGLRVSRYLWSEAEQKIVDAPGPRVTEARTYYLSSSVEASKKSIA
jgi:hypothetical protein